MPEKCSSACASQVMGSPLCRAGSGVRLLWANAATNQTHKSAHCPPMPFGPLAPLLPMMCGQMQVLKTRLQLGPVRELIGHAGGPPTQTEGPESRVHGPAAAGLQHCVALRSWGKNRVLSEPSVLQGLGRWQVLFSSRKRKARLPQHHSHPIRLKAAWGHVQTWGHPRHFPAVSSVHPVGARILQKVPSPGKPLLNTMAHEALGTNNQCWPMAEGHL